MERYYILKAFKKSTTVKKQSHRNTTAKFKMSQPHHHSKPSLMKSKGTTPTNIESNLLTAVLAGSGAAVVQTVTTYPFEFVKTGKQLYRSFPNSAHFKFHTQNWKEYFIGCNGLAVGNALKAGSRFVVFNSSSKFMSNEHGKTTAPRVVIAGIMTGFVESLWVIPFENIKTTSIQNYFSNVHHVNFSKVDAPIPTNKILQSAIKTNSSSPRIPLRGNHTTKLQTPSSTAKTKIETAKPATKFLNVVSEIYNTRGIAGFWQGSIITATRQILNSAVWFSSYSALKQLVDPTHELSPTTAMVLSLLSSVNVIILTQPIDVVKTRMQSKNFKAEYRDTLTCLVRTFMNEGPSKLWSGWLPRFFKVSLGGSITLYSYKAFESGIGLVMKEQPFQAE